MGEVSSGTTMTMQQQQQNNQTKKKKKGRPSLLDLQKRSLRQQQQQHHQQRNPNSFNLSSNPSRRASRRNPNSDSVSGDDDNDGDDDDDERKEKKLKLLHGLNSHPQYPTLLPNSLSFTLNPYGSDLPPNSNFDDNLEADIKRRKITAVNLGSDPMVIDQFCILINQFSIFIIYFKPQKTKNKKKKNVFEKQKKKVNVCLFLLPFVVFGFRAQIRRFIFFGGLVGSLNR